MKHNKWLLGITVVVVFGFGIYYYFAVYLVKMDTTDRLLGQKIIRTINDTALNNRIEYVVNIYQGNEQFESVQSLSYTIEKRYSHKHPLGGTSNFFRKDADDFDVALSHDSVICIIYDKKDTLERINVYNF